MFCAFDYWDFYDKDYGFIVDYKDLFKSLDKAVTDYTSEAFAGFDKDDVEGLLKDRLKKGKENLDSALESIKVFCEPVKPPKDSISFIEYFCGNTENPAKNKNQQKLKQDPPANIISGIEK